MSRDIEFDIFSQSSITEAIHQIKLEQDLVMIRITAIIRRMAQVAELSIQQSIAGGIHYDGDRTLEVYNDPIVQSGKSGVRGEVGIKGVSALFIEFGTGLMYETIQHPSSEGLGMGAGTYPGKGMIFDRPDGAWIYRGDAGSHGYELKNGAIMTYGNPPNPIVYKASLDVRREMHRIVEDTYAIRY